MDLNLTVLVFDNETDAAEALHALRGVTKAGQLHIDDSAVVVRHADGELKIKNELASGTEAGLITGGILGLIFSPILFPIAGVAIGAGAGAAISHMVGGNLDKTLVKDVSETLQPGGSALFVTTSQGNAPAVLAALRPFKATVSQTTVPTELESSLRAALADRG